MALPRLQKGGLSRLNTRRAIDEYCMWFQEGAKRAANYHKIGMATPNPDATRHDYILTIADQLFKGLSVAQFAMGADLAIARISAVENGTRSKG
jgi:hypothetical protein